MGDDVTACSPLCASGGHRWDPTLLRCALCGRTLEQLERIGDELAARQDDKREESNA